MNTITIGEKLDYCADQLSKEQPLFNESQSLNAEKQALLEDLEVGKIERPEDFPADISFWGYLGYFVLIFFLYFVFLGFVFNTFKLTEDCEAMIALSVFIVPFVLLYL